MKIYQECAYFVNQKKVALDRKDAVAAGHGSWQNTHENKANLEYC